MEFKLSHKEKCCKCFKIIPFDTDFDKPNPIVMYWAKENNIYYFKCSNCLAYKQKRSWHDFDRDWSNGNFKTSY